MREDPILHELVDHEYVQAPAAINVVCSWGLGIVAASVSYFVLAPLIWSIL